MAVSQFSLPPGWPPVNYAGRYAVFDFDGKQCVHQFAVAAVGVLRIRYAASAKMVRPEPCQNGPLLCPSGSGYLPYYQNPAV